MLAVTAAALNVSYDGRTPESHREWGDRNCLREHMEVAAKRICEALYGDNERSRHHENFDMLLYLAPVKGDANGCDLAYAPEIDAVVRLLGEMRRAKQDVFVNCTVGTWASPFWVMFADSIWRGGNDFAMLGTGSARQRWLTYRDNKIHDRFVRPCPLFPLNSMMMHGIIVGRFGPPAVMDRSDSPKSTQDFADEVWMGVACGTGLQEYYITPSLMHPAWWDILADGVKWMKANESALRDVHWVGGDPSADNGGKGAIYGYASADAGKGIVILRNSSDETLDFAEPLWKVLDIPETQAKRQVKSSKVVYSHDAELGGVKSLQDVLAVRLAPYGVVLVEFTMRHPSAGR